MQEIKLNGVAFNLQAVANYKNAEDFYRSPSHQHYWGNVTEEERHKRLTFVYEQANAYKDLEITKDGLPIDATGIVVDNDNKTVDITLPHTANFEIIPSAQFDKIISNTEQVDEFNKLLINELSVGYETKDVIQEDGTINTENNNPTIIEPLQNDSSTANKKLPKSKRSRRNSKDADRD